MKYQTKPEIVEAWQLPCDGKMPDGTSMKKGDWLVMAAGLPLTYFSAAQFAARYISSPASLPPRARRKDAGKLRPAQGGLHGPVLGALDKAHAAP